MSKVPLVLALLAAAAAGCTGDPKPEAAPAAMPAPPRTAEATCETRSYGEFPDAFQDPANLAVGPFLLGGAGIPTEASVIEELGGQKFAVLLRPGHVVTAQIPLDVRAVASLGFGPLPQGDVGFADGSQAVRFTACPDTLTFWPGFLFAHEPTCVPLDVYVDEGARPTRIEIELGARC